MVEMIVVLPILLFVMFAIVELSRAWFTLQVTTNAAREGARAAAVAKTANVTTEGNARIDTILSAAGITAASRNVPAPTAVSCGTPPCDQEVVATVSVNFQTFFPLLQGTRLQTINMTQIARMRFEGG